MIDSSFSVESDKLHYYEGAHEAMGSNYPVLVLDQRYNCFLKVAEIIPMTAKPVTDVIDCGGTI